MLTREIKLFTGIKVGEGRAMAATIREEALDDELTVLEAGFVGLLAHRKVMMRRVAKIGGLDKPAEDIVRKLTRTDWELLDRAMMKMDEERSTEAGLIEPEKANREGRSQPGGDLPGET